MSENSESHETSPPMLLKGYLFWSGVILAVLGLPFMLFLLGKVLAIGWFFPITHHCSDPPACPASSVSYIGMNWLAIISGAAFFGAIGAMMSLLLRRPIDEGMFLKHSPLRILLVLYGTGAVFAILMLALFIGGFIQGNLFPNFSTVNSWMGLSFRTSDWGKIVIWSFVAGFSERLMPNMLDRLIDHINSASFAKR